MEARSAPWEAVSIGEAGAAARNLMSDHAPAHRLRASGREWREFDTRSSHETMTCKQLGGPCDFAFSADTGDDIIKAQDGHLKQVVAAGNTEHESALQNMKSR
ncbi:hypothetical protein ACVBEQ_25020 [Nakamurella sp. GG22]